MTDVNHYNDVSIGQAVYLLLTHFPERVTATLQAEKMYFSFLLAEIESRILPVPSH